MNTDARTYQSSKELDGWVGSLGKVFRSLGQYYLSAIIKFIERNEDPEESMEYDPVDNTLTLRGHSSSIGAYEAGQAQARAGTALAFAPALYGTVAAFVAETPADMAVGIVVALTLFGISAGALATVCNWTVVDERVERPETEDVVEQYVDGEIEDEEELERQLEASLE